MYDRVCSYFVLSIDFFWFSSLSVCLYLIFRIFSSALCCLSSLIKASCLVYSYRCLICSSFFLSSILFILFTMFLSNILDWLIKSLISCLLSSWLSWRYAFLYRSLLFIGFILDLILPSSSSSVFNAANVCLFLFINILSCSFGGISDFFEWDWLKNDILEH